MKSTLFFFLSGIWVISFPLAVMAQKKNVIVKERSRKLVWSDEFNDNGHPASSKWSYEQGFVRGVDSQVYTQNRLENASVKDGYLVITGRKETVANPDYSRAKKAALELKKGARDENAGGTKPLMVRKFSDSVARYTSASLITLGKAEWTYGRIEVRAKVPAAKGSWPAIWMLGANRSSVGWPACGEIDIMEFVGRLPGNVFANVHYADAADKKKHLNKSNRLTSVSPSAGFHTYAIDWDSASIRFYYDDKLYNTFDITSAGSGPENPFRKPFYLVLNLALGGSMGGKLDDATLPQQFMIDYVRVYQ